MAKLHDPQGVQETQIIGFWKGSLADYGKPNPTWPMIGDFPEAPVRRTPILRE